MNWKRVLLAAFLILVISLGTVFIVLGRRGLPALRGKTSAPVQSEIHVYRDSYGIPHIKAENMDDLFFAQGYTQAQDRLWQMDLSRRAAAGRLAEIFGEDFIETDYFLRSLLMRNTAEATLPRLDPETKRVLERFADGVNHYLRENLEAPSFEFLLLGYRPEPWSAADTLSIGKLMAWDLGGNMETELFLAAALHLLPEEKAMELFPVAPADGPTVISSWSGGRPGAAKLQSSIRAARLLETLETVTRVKHGLPSREIGSNNWVVSGTKTLSGKTLLANDMHRGMGLPSIWYQTRLEIPDTLTLSGVIFPGIPGIIVGTNGQIAWGITNVGPDVQDLYIERRHPGEKYLFAYDGQWEEAVVLEEAFYVKGREEPLRREILITRNGPIISGLDIPGEDILSLRWTAHDYTQEIDAILHFAHARDWESFRRALELFHVPAQNFVYADREGNIAYKAAGKIPVRGTGRGLIPVPGWEPAYQWKGYIPFAELPEELNPESGFIATANNQIAPDDYPYFITAEWSPPYRARKITEVLQEGTDLDIASMKDLQYNVMNLQARELMPQIMRMLEQSSRSWSSLENQALDLLRIWAEEPLDRAELVGPALYHTLYIKMLEVAFAERMGPELFKQFLAVDVTNTFDRLFLDRESSAWFAGLPGGKEAVVEEAFHQAVSWLAEEQGGTPENWSWGSLHQIILEHNLNQVPLLGAWLNDGPHVMDGSRVTVAAASFSFREPFHVTNSAPWRSVIALHEEESIIWENLAGGVCGHPLSPHYRDQTPLWLNGEYLPVYQESAALIKKTPRLREFRIVPQ